jgi:hypothetical protein
VVRTVVGVTVRVIVALGDGPGITAQVPFTHPQWPTPQSIGPSQESVQKVPVQFGAKVVLTQPQGWQHWAAAQSALLVQFVWFAGIGVVTVTVAFPTIVAVGNVVVTTGVAVVTAVGTVVAGVVVFGPVVPAHPLPRAAVPTRTRRRIMGIMVRGMRCNGASARYKSYGKGVRPSSK